MQVLADYKELVLLPPLAIWLAMGGKRPPWAIWTGIQIFLALAAEGVGKWMMVHHLPNHAVYNAYMVLEYISISMTILFLSASHRRTRNELLSCGLLFASAFLLDLMYHVPEHYFASNALVIGGLLLASQSGLALVRRMLDSGETILTREAEFWILLSVVFYFFCLVPILGLYGHLSTRSSVLAEKVYSINDLLFIVRYSMLAWGLWLLRERIMKEK